MSDDTYTSGSERLIYHIFADIGVESEPLSAYGNVVRVGINPRDTNESDPIKADARAIPLEPGADLAVLHPPCTKWSPLTSISGDPDDHPDMIPLARELGKELADHYIIENRPNAPLRDPVRLKGDIFGLPIEYERAFETSFHVEQPTIHMTFGTECSTYFSADRSKDWWRSVKGVSGDYPKEELVKGGIPAPYIHYLMRAYLRETVDTGMARSDPAQKLTVTDGGTAALSDTDSDRDGGDAGDE